MLGFIIDPDNPERSNHQVLEALISSSPNSERLFHNLQTLSGRFVLLYKTDSEYIVVGDPCGSRQIYYDPASNSITSSVKLYWDALGTDPKISGVKKEIISLEDFKILEQAWFGDESLDDRLFKLLPNHYYDFNKRCVERIPINSSLFINEKELHEYACHILEGSMKAIRKRFQVLQTLTAGWDTRTLLAASREYTKDTEFVVFVAPDYDDTTHDIRIPLRLGRRFDLFLRVVRPMAVRPDFIEELEKMGIVPLENRIPTLQYLYDHYLDKKVVRLAGLPSDIIKSTYYGYTSGKVSSDMLYAFSFYYGKCSFFKQKLASWLGEVSDLCVDLGVQVLDLFYWEQRLGNWGATYAFDQDIAIEEYWPHGHRNLLFSAMRIDVKKTFSNLPATSIKQLSKKLWNDLLNEEVNPMTLKEWYNWRIRSNAMLRYQKIKWKNRS